MRDAWNRQDGVTIGALRNAAAGALEKADGDAHFPEM